MQEPPISASRSASPASTEGPCRSFPFGDAEIDAALGDFLERFLEDASAP
jgi:hypothetical protein